MTLYLSSVGAPSYIFLSNQGQVLVLQNERRSKREAQPGRTRDIVTKQTLDSASATEAINAMLDKVVAEQIMNLAAEASKNKSNVVMEQMIYPCVWQLKKWQVPANNIYF